MDGHKEILSRLKFIGRINKGEKINSQYVFVQQDDILTRLSRTFYNKDNRIRSLSFVKNTIERACEIIEKYLLSADIAEHAIVQHILNDLKLSKNGLMNLKDTYILDIKFCCDIDTILEEIDSKIFKFTKEIKKLNINPYEEKNEKSDKSDKQYNNIPVLGTSPTDTNNNISPSF